MSAKHKLTTEFAKLSPSPITVPTESQSNRTNFVRLNSSNKLTTDFAKSSPSPITVPTESRSNHTNFGRLNSSNKLTTDFAKSSPSPITVPTESQPLRLTTDLPDQRNGRQIPQVMSPSKRVKTVVRFRPNLKYDNVQDIFWYNNSPITENQYQWLTNRINKGFEIPEIFTYQTNILYKEEDGTCWFKGYNISCETYDGLKKEQEDYRVNLKATHKTPGLYRDPLERFTLLWLREIGQGEDAIIKNKNIERDWHLLKYGPNTAYRGFTIEPGTPGDVSNDMSTINNILQTQRMKEFNEEQYELLKRYYNKDEYKTEGNNVYNQIVTDIAIVKSSESNKNERMIAEDNLRTKYGEIDDFIVGGKRRKYKRKTRRINNKRKTNKKRKGNVRGKSRKAGKTI